MNVQDFLLPLLEVGVAGLGATALVFLVLPALRRRKALSLQALQMVAMIAEKVVMALEQTDGDLPGPEKKRRAEELVAEILSRLGIQAPRALVDAVIEAAVLLMNALARKKGRAA